MTDLPSLICELDFPDSCFRECPAGLCWFGGVFCALDLSMAYVDESAQSLPPLSAEEIDQLRAFAKFAISQEIARLLPPAPSECPLESPSL